MNKTKTETVVVSKKKKKVSWPKYTGVNGKKVVMKKDGLLHSSINAFGAIVSGPMTPEEIVESVTGVLAVTPKEIGLKLDNPPSQDFVPPTAFIRGWARQLLEYSTEALCVFGVNRKDPTLWLGVVPEQEVTSSMVDVDDFGPAQQQLSQAGYRCVGTLHTHPGGMTQCSGTDTGQLWNKFSGVHLIVTHTGVCSKWFSSKTITWDLHPLDEFKNTPLWPKAGIPKALDTSPTLIGEDGTSDYRQFINEKKWANFGYALGTNSHQQNNHNRRGKQKDWWEDYETPPARNNTNHRSTNYYYGEWDLGEGRLLFKEQNIGKPVSAAYCQVWPGYYHAIRLEWLAGEIPKSLKKAKGFKYMKPTQIHLRIVTDKKKKEQKQNHTGKDIRPFFDVLDDLMREANPLDEGAVLKLESIAIEICTLVQEFDTGLLKLGVTYSKGEAGFDRMKTLSQRVVQQINGFWGSTTKYVSHAHNFFKEF